MKKITQEELESAASLHRLWLLDPKSGKRAKFRDVDMRELNFNGMNLAGASLVSCDCSLSHMVQTDFNRATLDSCNLSRVVMTGAILGGTCLYNSSLRGATLTRVILNGYTDLDRVHF